MPEQVRASVVSMCQEIKYEGIAEFEFKKDAVTGDYKLLDVNPRTWSWVGITPACGVSLPLIAYRDLTNGGVNDGEPPFFSSDAEDGSIKWVRVLDDLVNCTIRNRFADYPQWHMGPVRWWRSLRADRLVLAEYSLRDPVPGIFATIEFIRSTTGGLVKSLLRRVGRPHQR